MTQRYKGRHGPREADKASLVCEVSTQEAHFLFVIWLRAGELPTGMQ
jgi:hypothetical protein